MKKQYILIISIVLIVILASLLLYQKLPEQMASHWNAVGEVDGYMNKQSHTIFFIAMTTGLPLLLLFIPKLDPNYKNIKTFEDQYHWLIVFMTLFFASIYGFSLCWALGYQFPINYFIIPALSLLFLSIGRILKGTKPNYTIGIRTAWTLSSEDNWNKTHEFSAKVFQYGALAMLLSVLTGKYAFLIFILGIFAMAFAPVLYSYILYRKTVQKK